MGKKNDMKSRKERFAQQQKSKTREQKVQEAKSSNAMLIWVFIAFAIVVVLVGYLVWQASNEGQTANNDAANEKAANEQSQNKDQKTNDEQKKTENPEPVKKEKVKVPISDKPNPVKKVVNGLPRYDFAPPMKIDTTKDYEATLKTNKGDVKIKLYASDAPFTVNNFIFLARDKFYDGVTFHRIIKDFMVQTGDPEGTGAGGPGYTINDEFSLEHDYDVGVVAMAKRPQPNTAGSQFFIGTGPQVKNLSETRDYTIFGQVTEGLDVLQTIASTPVGANDAGEQSKPLEKIVVNTIDIKEL